MHKIALLSLLMLMACSTDPVAPRTAQPPDAPSFARRPKPSAADAGPLSIAPEAVTVAVGETTALTSSYTIEKAGNFVNFFWGCTPDPICWNTVFIVPNAADGNASALVTGVASGTAQVYVADGLGLWSYATVTVQ